MVVHSVTVRNVRVIPPAIASRTSLASMNGGGMTETLLSGLGLAV